MYIPINLNNNYKKGGNIYIKPSKKGTFTTAAKKRGMGVQKFASKVMANKDNYSSAMVKKANFAKNAAGWKHGFGDDLKKEFEDPGKFLQERGLTIALGLPGAVADIASRGKFSNWVNEHGQLVGTVGGAAVGAAAGNPMMGAQIGSQIGSKVQDLEAQDDLNLQNIDQQALNDKNTLVQQRLSNDNRQPMYFKSGGNLPKYSLGSWLGDNKQGVIGGLKTAGGAALLATGVGAPIGVGLMASGISDIGQEISQDNQQAKVDTAATTQQDILSKQNLVNQRLGNIQNQGMYPDGGQLPTYKADSTITANYRGQAINNQNYGDFEKAFHGDLLKSKPLYDPNNPKNIIATENYYKGVPGPVYLRPTDIIGGDRLEKYKTDKGTNRFAGSELPVKAKGGYLEETRHNKDLTYYANGGTHEANPKGGIRIGNKGLVEQDEFRYKDYIFSNRF